MAVVLLFLTFLLEKNNKNAIITTPALDLVLLAELFLIKQARQEGHHHSNSSTTDNIVYDKETSSLTFFSNDTYFLHVVENQDSQETNNTTTTSIYTTKNRIITISRIDAKRQDATTSKTFRRFLPAAGC